MLKPYQIVVLVCTLIGSIVCDADMEKLADFKQQIRKICQEKTKISSELIDQLTGGSLPEGNKELKCYVGCNLEQSKLIKDGKFDKVAALEMLEQVPENIRDVAKKALNACAGKHDSITDPCELGWEIVKCWKNAKVIF